MAEFVINLLRTGDGVSDLLPEQFAVTLLQPMHVALECSFRHAELGGGLRVGVRTLFSRKKTLQQIKPWRLPVGPVLLQQSGAHVVEEAERPVPFVEGVGTPVAAGFQVIKLLRGDGVKGQVMGASATLLVVSPIPFVGQEMV